MFSTSSASSSVPWVGQSLPPFEDALLLTGRGRYFDDTAAPPGAYDVLANFQRSFSIHAVIARALRVPGTYKKFQILAFAPR